MRKTFIRIVIVFLQELRIVVLFIAKVLCWAVIIDLQRFIVFDVVDAV